MFRDIHKSIVTKKWMRNIPLLLLIIPVLSVELYLFAYGRDDTFRDRFSFYSLSLLTGVSFFLFPKNKKYFAAYFICSLLLCTIYVIHTSLLYGNNGGFDIENLMHLCDFRSMLQFLKFNPHYIWEGPLVILFLAMISFVSGYFIFEACYPRPRKIFINKMFLLFLAGAMLFLWGKTFYPVDDFISIAKFASEVRKYRSFDKEIYWRQGIKVTAKTADEIIASPGKNLVFIILESTELAYLDEKFFPGLLPELKKWRAGTQSFENVTMARNATLTFGAMFSMMTGAFLTSEYLVSGVNSHTKPYVGSRLASLPKILNKAGYHQFFLAGHSGNFAGTENFVKNQKYDETWFGIDRSIREPSWEFSVRDSKVFEKAWEFFQRAAASEKPFNVTLLTVDAHGPHGFYDPSEPGYPHPGRLNDKLYNAMYASDHALGKFLKRIEKHPAGKDTCIVIVSDHLAHNYTVSTAKLNEFPNRRLLFLVKNSVREKYDKKIKAMTFDIAPTVLDAMGVTHDYVFPLGESLYSDPHESRLQNSEQQEVAFSIYTRLKSTPPVHVKAGLKVQYQPYPHIAVGELTVPLRYGAVSDKLRAGDIFILPIPDNKIFDNPSLIYCPTAKNFADKVKRLSRYIFVAGMTENIARQLKRTETEGFLLGIVEGEKSIVKFAKEPEMLFLSAREIKKIY